MFKTSPFKFFTEVRQELSRVTWPSRKELTFTTISVIAMSAVAGLFFFAVDEVIALAVRTVLGIGA